VGAATAWIAIRKVRLWRECTAGRPVPSHRSNTLLLQNSRITWTGETLDKWLTDPDKLVPNNDMSFSVPNSEERSAIIAYLKETSKK
jgi:cytochrome c2